MNAKTIMEDISKTRENFKMASQRLWDFLEEKNEFRDPLDPLTLGSDGEILLELAHISARRELEARNLAEQLISSLNDERAETILRLRYIDGMRWDLIVQFFDDIDQPLGERQIYRIHSNAMAKIDKVLEQMSVTN